MAVLKSKKQSMKRIQIRVGGDVWRDYSECKCLASKLGWTIDYIADFEKWMIRQNIDLRKQLEVSQQESAAIAGKKLHAGAVTENEADEALNGIGG